MKNNSAKSSNLKRKLDGQPAKRFSYANAEARAKLITLSKGSPREMQSLAKMLLYLMQNLNDQLKGLDNAVQCYYPKISKVMKERKINIDSETGPSKKIQ